MLAHRRGRVCTYTLARPRVCPRVAFRCVRRVRRAALRLGALPSIRLDMQIIRRKNRRACGSDVTINHADRGRDTASGYRSYNLLWLTGSNYGPSALTMRAPFFPLHFVVHVAAIASRRCPGNVDCSVDLRISREPRKNPVRNSVHRNRICEKPILSI